MRPTHSSWSGTPSAAGNSDSLSSLLLLFHTDGRRIGAGVTGRLGRSTSLGKSVSLVLSWVGSVSVDSALGSVVVVVLDITWVLAFLAC